VAAAFIGCSPASGVLFTTIVPVSERLAAVALVLPPSFVLGMVGCTGADVRTRVRDEGLRAGAGRGDFGVCWCGSSRREFEEGRERGTSGDLCAWQWVEKGRRCAGSTAAIALRGKVVLDANLM
jgi:hypothetical protein